MTLEDIRRVIANEEPYYPSYPGSDNPYRDGYYTEVSNSSNSRLKMYHYPDVDNFSFFTFSRRRNRVRPTFCIKVYFVTGLTEIIQIHR